MKKEKWCGMGGVWHEIKGTRVRNTDMHSYVRSAVKNEEEVIKWRYLVKSDADMIEWRLDAFEHYTDYNEVRCF